MRHDRFLSLAAACAAWAWASPVVRGAVVADFEAARIAAKAARAPIAVLIHGSDWNRAGEKLVPVWNDPRFAAAVGPATVLLVIDRKERPDPADERLAAANAGCNVSPRSLPAVVLHDSEGRLAGVCEGLPAIEEAGGLPAAVKRLQAVLARRDACWSRAKSLQGVRRAAALGEGLALMKIGLGPGKVYQGVLDEIKAADPADESGYAGYFSFSRDALLGMVQDKAGRNEHAAAEAELERWNRNTRLDNGQRQELQAARFALYQKWPDKKAEARKALQEMRDIDPKSDLGRAAAAYLGLLK